MIIAVPKENCVRGRRASRMRVTGAARTSGWRLRPGAGTPRPPRREWPAAIRRGRAPSSPAWSPVCLSREITSGDPESDERVVKYSVTKGYSLLFKRGTNVTINRPKIDKKSSISSKGLTLVRQGADWQPTGGAIQYQFLGQKGTANLMDYVAP